MPVGSRGGPAPNKQYSSMSAMARLQPSSELSAEEKSVWDMLVNDFPPGWFRPCDREMLQHYCHIAVLLRGMRKRSAKEDHVLEDYKGTLKTNPFWTAFNNLTLTFSKVGSQLKINPLQRYEKTPAPGTTSTPDEQAGKGRSRNWSPKIAGM